METVLEQFEEITHQIDTCDYLLSHYPLCWVFVGLAYDELMKRVAFAIIDYNTRVYNSPQDDSYLLASNVILAVELLSQTFNKSITSVEDDLQLVIEDIPLTGIESTASNPLH